MKIAGAHGITRSRVPLIAMLALAATIGLAGCSGDDGRSGATGPQGPGGGTGPTGPTGPGGAPGPSIEQGGTVVIGNGTTLTEEQIAAIGGLVATIDSASIAGNKPVIEFTVKTAHGGGALGLAPSVLNFMVAKLVPAADGIPSRWQSYVNRTQTASASGPQVLPSARQANTENGAAGTLVELDADSDGAFDDGKYRYTYAVDLANVTSPLAVAYEPSLTHRLGLEIRMSGEAEALAPDNPIVDLVPDGGAGSGNKLIAATENCENCHERFELHGGPRRNVEYCVTCHNPGTIDPDGGQSVDLAYMAHSIHSGEDRTNAYIVYGFGGTAHDYSEVTYPQSTLFCENCHTASGASPDGDAWLVNSSASACGGCHDAGLDKTGPDATTGRYAYTYTHDDFAYTAADGVCEECHRAGGAANDTLTNHVSGPRLQKQLGEQFVFEILGVTNVGQGLVPSVKFRVRKPDGTPYDIVNDPAFTHASASLNINMAWDAGKDITNATANGTEPGLRSNSTPRRSGYAIQMNIQQVRAAAQLAGQALDGSYTIPFFTALPVDTDDAMFQMDGHPRVTVDGVSVNAAAPMTVFYTGTPRPRLVSQAKCENCHELLSFHGQNRNGDPQACTICHNASGGYADEDLGPIAMGAMVHNLHAGTIPRTAGLTYPQRLANCEACHLPGSYNTARDGAIAISTGSGTDLFNMVDDTWDSATAGTCGTCHNSGPARAHITANGGLFDVVGGKSFEASSAVEACAVCHGEGRSADTVKAHAE